MNAQNSRSSTDLIIISPWFINFLHTKLPFQSLPFGPLSICKTFYRYMKRILKDTVALSSKYIYINICIYIQLRYHRLTSI